MKEDVNLIWSSGSNYWKTKFAVNDRDTTTDFLSTRTDQQSGEIEYVPLNKDEISRIGNLTNNSPFLEFVFYSAVLSILIQRYTGHNTVAWGSSQLAFLSDSKDKHEALLFYRNEINSDHTFKEIFTAIKDEVLQTANYNQFGWNDLHDFIGKEKSDIVTGWGICIEGINDNLTACDHFKIVLRISKRTGHQGIQVVANRSDLDIRLLNFFALNYREMINAVCSHLYVKIKELKPIHEVERELILASPARKNHIAFHRGPIHHLFEQQVILNPKATAICHENSNLTYQQLNDLANKLAHRLMAGKVVRNSLVAVGMENPMNMIIGILGILKSGAGYVPLDLNNPLSRIRQICSNASCYSIITDNESRHLLEDGFPDQLIVLEEEFPSSGTASENPETTSQEEDLLYVIHTSGSTGIPKGVMITHANVNDYLGGVLQDQDILTCSTFALMSTLSADLGNTILFSALVSGKTLHVFGRDTLKSAAAMHAYFTKNDLQCIKIVPSHWKALAFAGHELLPSRVLIFGGEELTHDVIDRIKNSDNSCVIINHYGPTETTIGKLMHKVNLQATCLRIPLGQTFGNNEVFVVDADLAIVPVGVRGELIIGGQGLAKGYLNNPEQTREKFIKDPVRGTTKMYYRTGDMVRRLPNGDIEFWGRTDSQIKIRGNRVELGEIENLISKSRLAQQAIVLLKGDSSNQRIVAYLVPNDRYDRELLLTTLSAQLPEYMIPVIMEMSEFPLTTNGKIDRLALPAPEFKSENHNKPTTPVEEAMVKIWAEILMLKETDISITDDFFALGGHSLLAVMVLSSINQELNVDLTIRQFFEKPTVRELASLVNQLTQAEYPVEIKSNEQTDKIPLSFSQERLWFIDQLQGTANYHISTVLKLEGNVNVDVLKYAFQKVIERHQILRSVIREEEGIPYQKVLPDQYLNFSLIDGSNFQLAELDQFIHHEAQRPFKLSTDPMMRITLVRLEAQRFILILVTHHIASDGWSQNLFISELMEFYLSGRDQRIPDIAPLAIQYSDYALWQRAYLDNETLEKKLSYWESKLTGTLPLNLPTDYHRPVVQSTKGELIYFDIDLATKTQLVSFSQREGVTSFMTLLGVFNTLLYRYSGQEDICVGSVTANRTQKEIESLIGFFVNTVALRCDLSNNPTFRELLQQVKTTTLEAYTYQDVPFDKIVERVEKTRTAGRTPLFQAMFVLQNITAKAAAEWDDVQISMIDFGHGTSKFDLLFNAEEHGNGISVGVEYCTDLFMRSTIERMMESFQIILAAILKDSSQRVDQLPLLAKTAELDILAFNKKRFPVPEQQFIECFMEQALANPHQLAVSDSTTSFTYRQLHDRSAQLANVLIANGVVKESPVPVLLERSADALTAIIGVWMAGAAYVPIETNFPNQRILEILTDCRAGHIITSSSVMQDGLSWISPFIQCIIALDKINDKQSVQRRFDTTRIEKSISAQLFSKEPKVVPGNCEATTLMTGNEILTISEYERNASHLYEFLKLNLGKKDRVAILIDDPLVRAAAILALTMLETEFRIVPDFTSRQSAAKFVAVSQVNVLIADKNIEEEADSLYWQEDQVTKLLLIETAQYSDTVKIKEEGFKSIFNFQSENRHQDLNGYGWNNSYNGDAFRLDEMQQYVDNFTSKISPHLAKDHKVLEIGCGHGIVAFNLAGKVQNYLATDIADVVIEKNRILAKERKLSHLSFEVAAAGEIGRMKDQGPFDIIIISSVIHYFPGTVYLQDVLEQCIALLTDEGAIYLDDLMDLDKKSDLEQSILAYKKDNPAAPSKTNWNNDLFVPRNFFSHLADVLPDIHEYEISDKLGTIENELKKIRYDVLLKIKKSKNKTQNHTYRLVHRFDTTSKKNVNEIIKNIVAQVIGRPAAVLDVNDLLDCSPTRPQLNCLPGDLAYIIYTSGSAGKPKGVMIEHGGMINHLSAKINDLKMSDVSRVSQNASLTFDISIWQMLSSLLTGGRVAIYSDELILDVPAFLDAIDKDGITILEVVPSYLAALMAEIETSHATRKLHALQMILVTGEPLHMGQVKRWFNLYPDKQMINAYGPTEASDDITHAIMYKVPQEDYIVVGEPIQNLNVYVFNQSRVLCPIGVTGEIAVSGIGVGRGYLNNPELTATNFILDSIANGSGRMYKTGDLGRWRPDGSLECLGRKDSQVKLRGFRIELGEIENALSECALVKSQAVLINEDDTMEKSLVAYIIPSGSFAKEEILDYLRSRLPEYMIPSAVIEMEKLPLTANGKIDRKALPKMQQDVQTAYVYVAPRTEVEEQLTAIWQELLKVERISIYDNFFELGGHSLMITRVASAINKIFNLSIPVKILFAVNRIADLADYIELQTISEENTSARFSEVHEL